MLDEISHRTALGFDLRWNMDEESCSILEAVPIFEMYTFFLRGEIGI